MVLLGFSGGPRNCIGKNLALLESKIALVKLMKRYQWMEVPKDNIGFEFKFIYTPEPFDTILTPYSQ